MTKKEREDQIPALNLQANLRKAITNVADPSRFVAFGTVTDAWFVIKN
jgi:hypothetical protein